MLAKVRMSESEVNVIVEIRIKVKEWSMCFDFNTFLNGFDYLSF
jgi:hypothetical protein